MSRSYSPSFKPEQSTYAVISDGCRFSITLSTPDTETLMKAFDVILTARPSPTFLAFTGTLSTSLLVEDAIDIFTVKLFELNEFTPDGFGISIFLFTLELKLETSTSIGIYSKSASASALPYAVTLTTLVSIALIALPNVTVPTGIILIGTSLLGDEISMFAFTFSGTISTFTTFPFASYALIGTFL